MPSTDVFALSDLVVEVLNNRGTPERPSWMAGSGFLIGSNLVLTVAHNVDMAGELLIRFRGSEEYNAVVSSLPSGRPAFDLKQDIAVLEITSSEIPPRPKLLFARINDQPTLDTPNVEDCWAIGFPRFQEKARLDRNKPLRESARVDGSILMGEGLVEGLLTLSVTRAPRDLDGANLSQSQWQGISGALVFAGKYAIGLIIEHHIPAGSNALTITPIAALDKQEDATAWWRLLGVENSNTLPVLPSVNISSQFEVSRIFALEPETVLIPHGPFWMGSPAEEAAPPEETELHQVTLKDYRIGVCPVTNEQYAEFLRLNPAHPVPKGDIWFLRQPQTCEDHPVTGVSWHDAQAFCRWLSQRTQRHYRLPAEAEWEKAARGPNATIFPWGNDWEEERCNSGSSGTTPVGMYLEGASSYCCFDMAGNVSEWTSTIWGSNPRKNAFPYPYNPGDGREDGEMVNVLYPYRILRGGSYEDEPSRLRCAARHRAHFDTKTRLFGFRVLMEL